MIVNAIKSIFTTTSGQLLIHDVDLPKEVREYENEIFYDLEMKNLKEDKINLKNDSIRLKKDAHKAVKNYYSEFVNG